MLKELLLENVKAHDEDVAVFLSGGIDSCIVLNLLM